jgi:hypothetical protein
MINKLQTNQKILNKIRTDMINFLLKNGKVNYIPKKLTFFIALKLSLYSFQRRLKDAWLVLKGVAFIDEDN